MRGGCSAALTRSCSARKLISVYQDNRREYVAQLGLELYQSAGGAAGGAAGTDSEGESEDEGAFQVAAPPPVASPQAPHQLQLAVVPAPSQVVATAAAGRTVRAPMAHLLSLMPPKRAANRAWPCAPACLSTSP